MFQKTSTIHAHDKMSASYPDVSLLRKMCAQRKAGRRQPAVCTLPMVPCGSSPVTRFALASAMRKNEAPEEEADKMLCIKKCNPIFRGMRDISKNRLHCKRKLIIILFEILKDKMINREIKS